MTGPYTPFEGAWELKDAAPPRDHARSRCFGGQLGPASPVRIATFATNPPLPRPCPFSRTVKGGAMAGPLEAHVRRDKAWVSGV